MGLVCLLIPTHIQMREHKETMSKVAKLDKSTLEKIVKLIARTPYSSAFIRPRTRDERKKKERHSQMHLSETSDKRQSLVKTQ
jgi:hypothetical protein